MKLIHREEIVFTYTLTESAQKYYHQKAGKATSKRRREHNNAMKKGLHRSNPVTPFEVA